MGSEEYFFFFGDFIVNVKFKKLNLQWGGGLIFQIFSYKNLFPLSFMAFIFHESEFTCP